MDRIHYRTNHPYLVAEVGEPPHVSEVDCEPDDGEEEVHVAVPRHAITSAAGVAAAAGRPRGDGDGGGVLAAAAAVALVLQVGDSCWGKIGDFTT